MRRRSLRDRFYAPNRFVPGVLTPPLVQPNVRGAVLTPRLVRGIVLGNRRATRGSVAPAAPRLASHLMKVRARGVAAVVGGVDLEVREKGGGFETEEADYGHGEAADFEIGAFAGAEGEHRPPGDRKSVV